MALSKRRLGLFGGRAHSSLEVNGAICVPLREDTAERIVSVLELKVYDVVVVHKPSEHCLWTPSLQIQHTLGGYMQYGPGNHETRLT